jgi:hypothetical protein
LVAVIGDDRVSPAHANGSEIQKLTRGLTASPNTDDSILVRIDEQNLRGPGIRQKDATVCQKRSIANVK